ncbi:MAG: type II toxin-antitoxin system HicA family toxin [Planctomycetota bacterium]
MSRQGKLLDLILSGRSDSNVRFDALCGLLDALGFEVRVRGSHHIFTRGDVAEILNLQPRKDGTAKPYQVKQVRDILVRYQIGFDE